MTQKKDLKMKLLLSLAMTALLFFSQLILANDAIDWCCKIGVNGLLTCAEKTLPAPFFRHARWKEKVDHKGSDLPMQKKTHLLMESKMQIERGIPRMRKMLLTFCHL